MFTYCDISFDDKIVMSVSDIDFLIFMWDLRTGKLVRKISGKNI
jgi:WD40 repeat protein